MSTQVTWTPELREQAVAEYQAMNPTPETSTEIVKEIAENMEMSPNGVRMVLVQAGVYLKKGGSDTASDAGKEKTTTTKKDGTASKRVSKEDSIAALRAAIEQRNGPVDEDILSKLTGKAAVYFLQVLQA